MINSRQKGAAGEREFAKELTRLGFPAIRGQQKAGGVDSPDVKCEALSAYHFEVKRVERLNIDTAYEQAVRDSAGAKIPVVAHRRNRKPWLITLSLEQWAKLIGK